MVVLQLATFIWICLMLEVARVGVALRMQPAHSQATITVEGTELRIGPTNTAEQSSAALGKREDEDIDNTAQDAEEMNNIHFLKTGIGMSNRQGATGSGILSIAGNDIPDPGGIKPDEGSIETVSQSTIGAFPNALPWRENEDTGNLSGTGERLYGREPVDPLKWKDAPGGSEVGMLGRLEDKYENYTHVQLNGTVPAFSYVTGDDDIRHVTGDHNDFSYLTGDYDEKSVPGSTEHTSLRSPKHSTLSRERITEAYEYELDYARENETSAHAEGDLEFHEPVREKSREQFTERTPITGKYEPMEDQPFAEEHWRNIQERDLEFREALTARKGPAWDRGIYDRPEKYLLETCDTGCARFLEADLGGVEGSGTALCRNLYCHPCSCVKAESSACQMGVCCLENAPKINLKQGDLTGCMKDHNYAIVRCPESWRDATVREKCENTSHPENPVTDSTTMLAFRNEHCALCNHVDSIVPWMVEVSCKHFQFLFMVMSEDELLQKAKLMPDVCDVRRAPPPELAESRLSCRRAVPWFTDDVIASCNVTGWWTEYQGDVDFYCKAIRALPFRVAGLGGSWRVFQNLFCAICNGVDLKWFECYSNHSWDWQPKEDFQAPLTFLLGVDNRDADGYTLNNDDSCHAGKWLNPDGHCQNITCATGKTFNPVNRTCSSALPFIRALSYKFNISLVPDKPVLAWVDGEYLGSVGEMLHGIVTGKVQHLTEFYFLNITLFATEEGKAEPYLGSGRIVLIELEGVLTANMFDNRDYVEQSLVDLFLLSKWTVNISFDQQQSVSLTPVHLKDIREVLLRSDFGTEVTQHVFQYGGQMPVLSSAAQGKTIPRSSLLQVDPTLVCPYLGIRNFSLNYAPLERVVETEHSDPNGLDMPLPMTSAEMSDTESLNPSRPSTVLSEGHEIPSTQVNGGYSGTKLELELHFESVKTKIEDLRYVSIRENKVLVCLHLVEDLTVKRKMIDELTWQYYLSMTLIPLSIICLALTVVVYMALKTLRTQPGLNTIGTCTSLLLAQLSLLLATHKVVGGACCKVLGMIVHASWLSAFSWTSVCSFHMFGVFSSKTYQGTRKGSWTKMARNVALTVLLPIVAVAAVVVLSYVYSEGRSIGYSEAACYLETPVLVGVGMVLPVSVAVVVNIVLFALTVSRIHEVIRLQVITRADPDSALQHVHAYARLSLLTGTTWVLSLVAEGFDLDWLRVLSILTNGGQGVLLFLSYVTRRRVAALLSLKFGLRKEGQTSISRSGMLRSSSSPMRTGVHTEHENDAG